MSTTMEIEENCKKLSCVMNYSSENIGVVMSAVVDRVKKMLEEKYSSDIVHVWYIDLINDNGQVFFLVQRKSSTPLSLDSNADVMFAEIDKTVGYESDRICGAMVYDYDENFLEKSSSKFMDFALCLDNDAVFKVI